MNSANNFGLAHLWAQGDLLTHGVAIALLAMSVAAWTVMLAKVWHLVRIRRAATALNDFWSAPDLAAGIQVLAQRAPASPLTLLAAQAQQAAEHFEKQSEAVGMGGTLDRSDFLTRALRQSIGRSMARLEGGLTVLASVGSTAPFVGLFGTVWGIYHALVNIGGSGQMALEQVTGPVGEALIMTALGLGVAIPAVLAYNTFTRANRLLFAEVDAFAHDIHAYLTTGARVSPAAEVLPHPRLKGAA